MYSANSQFNNQNQRYPQQQNNQPNQKYNQQYSNNQQFQQQNNYYNTNQHQPRMPGNPNDPYGQGSGRSSGKNRNLIQPPSLHFQQQQDMSEHMYQHQKPSMTLSNNMHSEFDGYAQPQDDQNWANEAEIASMFWQQKCMTMLQRFEWFYQRYQIIRQEYGSLSQEMEKMDSQEQWHNFQEHHNEVHEKIEDMEQELTAVLGQNEQLIQQKQTHDSQNVWEQRYQQLLGNFKSLQEEKEQNQANGANSMIKQQYRQLEEHCAQLQYQYNEMYNQYQKYRQGDGQLNDMEQQLTAYMKEIQNYDKGLKEMQGQNIELNNMIVQLEQENNHLKQQNYNIGMNNVNSGNADRKRYQELLDQVQQKEEEIRSLQEEFRLKVKASANIHNYEQTIAQKQERIRQLEISLEKTSNQLRQTKTNNITALQSIKSTLKEEHNQEKLQLLKNIKELEKEIETLKKQNNKSGEYQFKIENLEKKLAYSNKETQNLHQNIKKKNQELVELRGVTYEVEKLKEAQGQFNKAVDQRDRLAEILRKKNIQIDNLVGQNERLVQINLQINNKRQEYNVKSLKLQIQDLNDNIQHLKNQLNRQKTLLLSKQDFSVKLEEQLKHTKQKLIMLTQLYESQTSSWKEKEVKLLTKSNDYDAKIKNLDYEYNLQLKETLEREVAVLRKQNVEKQGMIRKYDENEVILLAKIAVYEKQQGQFDKQQDLLRQKNTQFQTNLSIFNKKYKELQQHYKLKQTEINTLQARLSQTQSKAQQLRSHLQQSSTLLSNKNKTISELQNHLRVNLSKAEESNRYISENSKLMLLVESLQRDNVEKLEVSKIKSLADGNSRASLTNNNKNNNNIKFQGLINVLTQQNALLKEEMNSLVIKYNQIAQQPINQLQLPSQSQLQPQSSSQVNIKSNSEIPLNLNKRLNQFNNRLQQTIRGSSSTLNNNQWEQERINLINHYQTQIRSLKEQLVSSKQQLQNSTVSNNNNNNPNTNQSLSQTKKQTINKYSVQTQHQQLQFLRTKAKDYEQRNNQLLKLNESLKEKIQSILKIKPSSGATLQFYKTELNKVEEENSALKEKYRKLAEENKVNRLELGSKNSKVVQEYEFRMIEKDMTIQEQQRKITALMSQKLTTDNEKANIVHNNNIGNHNNVSNNSNIQNSRTINAYGKDKERHNQSYTSNNYNYQYKSSSYSPQEERDRNIVALNNTFQHRTSNNNVSISYKDKKGNSPRGSQQVVKRSSVKYDSNIQNEFGSILHNEDIYSSSSNNVVNSYRARNY